MIQQFAYVIAPDGCCDYLTPWKMYEVSIRRSNINYYQFNITDDRNRVWSCKSKTCCHLNNRDWIIPEIGQWPEGWTKKQKMECLKKAGVGIAQSGFMRILGEEKPEPESTIDTFSSTDYQGRTNEQLEGSAKIFAICFVVMFLSLIIASIIL